MNNDIHFGLKINELIEARNISKTTAAKMMGYSRKGFSDAVDKEDVNTSILKKICSVFGVDMEYFLSATANNIYQKGNANIAGSGNVQYKGENNSMNPDNRIEFLLTENQHLKEQNQLLKQMVELLKPKPET